LSFPGSGEVRREEAGLWDTTDFDGRREEVLGRIQPGSGEVRREEPGLWDTTDLDGRREEVLGRIQGLDALRRIVLVSIECDAAGSGDERLELELRGSNVTGRRRDELAGRKVGVEAFRDVVFTECKVSGEGPREETELRFDVR